MDPKIAFFSHSTRCAPYGVIPVMWDRDDASVHKGGAGLLAGHTSLEPQVRDTIKQQKCTLQSMPSHSASATTKACSQLLLLVCVPSPAICHTCDTCGPVGPSVTFYIHNTGDTSRCTIQRKSAMSIRWAGNMHSHTHRGVGLKTMCQDPSVLHKPTP